eukprot:TRINITY_DN28348_c2_g1_i2.p1 TRINITY_DN28348_c2_g1~~TRINITY_DN28348_c2_g1_i2.p1  ORF type:complete len:156 (+),score=14.94 TRINITY_DN28348_c2_g1_i2:66-533(+)
MSKEKEFDLNTGARIPTVALGTGTSPPDAVGDAVITAVKEGYRHIDCARVYGNEKEIGLALKKLFEDGIVKREDLFLPQNSGVVIKCQKMCLWHWILLCKSCSLTMLICTLSIGPFGQRSHCLVSSPKALPHLTSLVHGVRWRSFMTLARRVPLV